MTEFQQLHNKKWLKQGDFYFFGELIFGLKYINGFSQRSKDLFSGVFKPDFRDILQRDSIGVKSRDPQKVHLKNILNVRTEFQLPSSI